MYWAATNLLQTGNHALKIQCSSLLVSLIPTCDRIPVLHVTVLKRCRDAKTHQDSNITWNSLSTKKWCLCFINDGRSRFEIADWPSNYWKINFAFLIIILCKSNQWIAWKKIINCLNLLRHQRVFSLEVFFSLCSSLTRANCLQFLDFSIKWTWREPKYFSNELRKCSWREDLFLSFSISSSLTKSLALSLLSTFESRQTLFLNALFQFSFFSFSSPVTEDVWFQCYRIHVWILKTS